MDGACWVDGGDFVEGEGFCDVFDQSAGFGVEEGAGLGVAVQHEEFEGLAGGF